MHSHRWPVAAILVIAATGCSDSSPSVERCGNLELARPLLVLESDLATASGLARVDTHGCVKESPSVALGGDPSLSFSKGRAFVAIRDRSRVVEIDPTGPRLIESRHFDIPPTERVTNPHDIAIASDDTLWVSRYNMDSLAILREDGALDGEIDLSAFADDDGIPEMESLIAIGDKVYIALERMTWTGSRYTSELPSLVVGIDIRSRSVIETISLEGRVPFGRMIPSPDDDGVFFVAVPGEFDSIDARDGIERVDTRSGTSRLVANEASLGGSPSDIAIVSETEGYAIVAGAQATNDTALVQWDPATGEVTRTLTTTPGEYRLWGLAIAGDDVIVGDRERRAPRLRVFSRSAGNERGSIPLEVLPPVSLVAVHETVLDSP